MQVLCLSCSQYQDGFGSSVPVSDKVLSYVVLAVVSNESLGSCPQILFFFVRMLFWLPFFTSQRMKSFMKNTGLTDVKAFVTLLLRLELC